MSLNMHGGALQCARTLNPVAASYVMRCLMLCLGVLIPAHEAGGGARGTGAAAT
jgi:hypothetical protein